MSDIIHQRAAAAECLKLSDFLTRRAIDHRQGCRRSALRPCTLRGAMSMQRAQHALRALLPHSGGLATAEQIGITMIELLIVLIILAILLTLAAPYMGEIIQRNRLAADSSMFNVDLAFARSEAIKRRQPVTVCSSGNGQTCSGNDDWSGGWIIFSDVASDAVPNVSASNCPQELTLTQDCLLRVRAQLSNGDVMRNTTTMSHIIFGPTGSAENVENQTEFLLCAPDRELSGESEYKISVTATGLVTKTVLSCAREG